MLKDHPVSSGGTKWVRGSSGLYVPTGGPDDEKESRQPSSKRRILAVGCSLCLLLTFPAFLTVRAVSRTAPSPYDSGFPGGDVRISVSKPDVEVDVEVAVFNNGRMFAYTVNVLGPDDLPPEPDLKILLVLSGTARIRATTELFRRPDVDTGCEKEVHHDRVSFAGPIRGVQAFRLCARRQGRRTATGSIRGSALSGRTAGASNWRLILPTLSNPTDCGTRKNYSILDGVPIVVEDGSPLLEEDWHQPKCQQGLEANSTLSIVPTGDELVSANGPFDAAVQRTGSHSWESLADISGFEIEGRSPATESRGANWMFLSAVVLGVVASLIAGMITELMRKA